MFKSLFCLLLVPLIISCGVSTLESEHSPVVPVQLQTFAPENHRLSSVKFFLWRDDNVSPTVMSEVFELADIIEDCDKVGAELSTQARSIREEFAPLETRKQAIKEALQNIRSVQAQAEGEARKLKRTLRTKEREYEAEKTKDPFSDPAQALLVEVTQLDTIINTLNEQADKIKASLEESNKQIEELDAKMVPYLEELKTINQQASENGQKGVDAVLAIDELVEYFGKSSPIVSIKFNTDTQTHIIQINTWDLKDDEGDRNFFSEAPEGKKPTIGNIRYTELGGIYEFEAYVFEDPEQTQIRETYFFKISRSKYKDTEESGVVTFTGDLRRERYTYNSDGSVSSVQINKGVAKLRDRNN